MHRDLKPHNLILGNDRHIKLIDFGDAKTFEEPDKDLDSLAESLDRRGTLVGTINYIAPEMIENNESSPATDFWALGCIIYKMLTGKLPF